jgi:hypothetical protein
MCHIVTNEFALNAFIWGDFVAERLSCVCSFETKCWRLWFEGIREVEAIMAQWLVTKHTHLV